MNWDALSEKLAAGFPDHVVVERGPKARHEVDQALAGWRDRITAYGIDIENEEQLFAFVAGLCEFESYLTNVTVPLGWFWPIPEVISSQMLLMALGSVIGTLRPYIEAHVPPGSVGSGYASDHD